MIRYKLFITYVFCITNMEEELFLFLTVGIGEKHSLIFLF